MIEAVIFDVDGTLVDSVDLHAECWREAFLHFGKNVGLEKIRSQIGKGGDQLLPVFLSREENAAFGESLVRLRGELWKARYLPHVTAFPRVRELFLRILEAGQKIALASSSKRDELESYLRIARVDDLRLAPTSASEVRRSKPAPDVFHAALARLSPVDRDRVVVVGDSPWDALGARRAELPIVGVRCGGFSEHDLFEAGCCSLYDDPAQLLAHYEASPISYSADTPVADRDLPPAIDEPQPPIVRSVEHPPRPL